MNGYFSPGLTQPTEETKEFSSTGPVGAAPTGYRAGAPSLGAGGVGAGGIDELDADDLAVVDARAGIDALGARAGERGVEGAVGDGGHRVGADRRRAAVGLGQLGG